MQQEIEQRAKELYPDNMGGLEKSSVDRYRAGYVKGYKDAMQQPAVTPVWVKANERIPPASNPPKLFIVKWDSISGNHFLRYLTANQLEDIRKVSVLEYYWLDESESPSKEGANAIEDKSGLRETIEDIIYSAGKHNQEQCTEIADAILHEYGQPKEGNNINQGAHEDNQLDFSIQRGDLWKVRALASEQKLAEQSAKEGNNDRDHPEQAFEKWVKENVTVLGEFDFIVGQKRVYGKKELRRVYDYLTKNRNNDSERKG